MRAFYKHLLPFLCLFATVTYTAQAASTDLADGYYYITSKKSAGYSIWAQTDSTLKAVETTTTDDPVYPAIWQVSEESNGTQTIKNIVTGTYIQSQSTNSSPYTLGTDGHGFTISLYSSDDGTYNVWSAYSATAGSCQGLNLNYDNSIVAWWQDSDEGNQWTFTAVTLTEAQLKQAATLTKDLSGTYAIKSGVVESVIKDNGSALIYTPYDASSIASMPACPHRLRALHREKQFHGKLRAAADHEQNAIHYGDDGAELLHRAEHEHHERHLL